LIFLRNHNFMKGKVIFILLTLGVVIGGVLIFTRNKNSIPDSALAQIKFEEVLVSPESYDVGKMIMKNGFVIREYEIKNNSKNILRVKNIVTSCMCTKAQVVFDNKRTRFYGMEMQGAKNPNIDFDIPAQSSAKLTVRFDPAAHGIVGVGPINRSVYLTFPDPVGQKEVKFIGEVVLK